MSFNNEMIELNDLALTLYQKRDRAQLARFYELLIKRGYDDGSIRLQEYWGQFYAMLGLNLQAIKHYKRARHYVRRLISLGGPDAHFDDTYIAGLTMHISWLTMKHNRF